MNRWWFDSHMHVMSEKRMKGGVRWAQKAGFDMGLDQETVNEEQIIQHIHESQIRYFFNFFFPLFPKTTQEILDWQTEFARRTPGAFPFVSVHVNDGDPLPFVKEAFENRHFVGLKMHAYAQRLRLSDPALKPVYQYVEEQGKLAVFHTGYEEFYGDEGITPDLQEIIEQHPGLKVIAAHMLYTEVEKAFEWLDKYPNLYLDGTNCLLSLEEDGDLDKFLPLMEKYAHRIVYGSDFAMSMYRIKKIWNHFERFPISETAKVRIGQQNPLNLLRASGWPFRGEEPVLYHQYV